MSNFYSKYLEDYSDPENNSIESYGTSDIRFISKKFQNEGFEVYPRGYEPEDSHQYPRFVDSSRKVLIDNSLSFGHFISNWLYVLVRLLKSNESLTVLMFEGLDNVQLSLNHTRSLTEYLEIELTKRGHRVEYINNQKFFANNFINIKTPFGFQLHSFKPVSEFLIENLSPSVKPGTKKIYLSRGKVTSNQGVNGNSVHLSNTELETLTLSHIEQHRESHKYGFSTRILNEDLMEEYLKTLGFIVIYPEDFESFHDQLDTIASAKILMSATSSSLNCCLVLAENAFVVELTSPMFVQTLSDGTTPDINSAEIHNYYKVLSLVNNNSYVSISNMTSEASDVIESIEKNKTLKTLLSS